MKALLGIAVYLVLVFILGMVMAFTAPRDPNDKLPDDESN